jgi:hypothetical protein
MLPRLRIRIVIAEVSFSYDLEQVGDSVVLLYLFNVTTQDLYFFEDLITIDIMDQKNNYFD